MSKRVILFNGAPNSGKDASASIMKKLFGFGEIHAFKDALYEATAKHFNIDLDTFIKMASDRDLKEKKTNLLQNVEGVGILKRLVAFLLKFFVVVGISPRDALIFVSEKVIKPKNGKDYFGKKLLAKLKSRKEDMFFIPDSGFVEELRPLIEAGYDVHVVRIHRDGTSFDNDSRIELTDEILKDFGIKGFDINNNGTLEDLEDQLLKLSLDGILAGRNKL